MKNLKIVKVWIIITTIKLNKEINLINFKAKISKVNHKRKRISIAMIKTINQAIINTINYHIKIQITNPKMTKITIKIK